MPAPPFPPRGPSGRFPRFIGTTKALRLPTAPPASLRCLRSAVPWWRPSFALAGGGMPCAREPGPLIAGGPSGTIPRRQWGLPGSWMNPFVFAPLSDPGGISAPSLCGASMLPRTSSSVPAPPMAAFRGSITRLARSLSTLRRAGHPTATQDSLPAGGWPLPGGTPTRWVQSERFRDAYFITSPFPRLILAQGASQLIPGADRSTYRVLTAPPGSPGQHVSKAGPGRAAPRGKPEDRLPTR